jgi:hypothetical protein
MKKISVKNIVAFNQRSPKSRKGFLKSLSKEKSSDSEGGGNYWVRSISALSNAFKTNENKHIKDKIDDITEDDQTTTLKRTKDMYRRNLQILHNYEDFDFSTWYPNDTCKILNKVSKKAIIEIKRIPIQVLPNQIFTFQENEVDYVGAILFVAKLEAYKKEELGIFAETLFYFLKTHFSKKYKVKPEYCLVVDVLNLELVTYKSILDEEIPGLLFPILKAIKENL